MVRLLTMLWVLLYTTGLTRDQKTGRRAEIASDMHEQFAFALEQGEGAIAINGSIASRTVRGMLADVLWRLEEGRDGEGAVRAGGDPPLPWFTMWFVGAVIVAGCVASTQVATLGDTRALWVFAAAGGAGLLWLGLYLATHTAWGPLCIAVGTVCIAAGLWWTVVVPVAAASFGIAGLRRAQRLATLLHEGT